MVTESTSSVVGVAERVMQGREDILAELHKVIVGQELLVEEMVSAVEEPEENPNC